MAGAVVGALRVVLGLNAGEFSSGTQKAGKSMDNLARKAKALGGAIGGAFAVSQLTSFAKDAVRAFGVQEDAIASVDAVLKTTGGTAGFTSKQLQDMASALQDVTTFGDEAILRGATSNLLTFGNIVGPVFERAQKAALDLSQQFNVGLKESSIQLGKALNDPILGISALSRVGIAFTQQQKDQIKTLVESNKVMEAQGVILEEVEKFYGDAAEAAARTTAGQLTQAANAFGDAVEKIGESIAPAVLPAAKAIQSMAVAFQGLSPEMRTAGVVAAGAAVALAAVGTAIGVFITVLGTMAGPLSLAVIGIAALSAAVVTLRENLMSLEERSQASLAHEFETVNNELAKVNQGLNEVIQTQQEIAGDGGMFKALRLQRVNSAMDRLLQQQAELIARKKELEGALLLKGWETSIESQMVQPIIDLGIEAKLRAAETQQALDAVIQKYQQLGDQGLHLAEQLRTPHEIMMAQQAELAAALDQRKISADEFANAMQRATYVSANAYAGMASDIVSSLSSVFGESKAFAIAQAIINTAEGVTRALAAYPPPFNFAAAAAVGAAGAAQIAAIKSTTKGGKGGGAAAVAPSAAAGPTQTPQPVTVNIHGDRFDRKAVFGLIDQINEAGKDGKQVIVRAT